MQQQYRIFLASSAELRNDRIAFELAISKMNKSYEDEGKHFSFRLDVWEDFNTAIAPISKQQEYNESISNCHIFCNALLVKSGYVHQWRI